MRDFKEFERGDWVVFDTSKPYCRLLPPCLMKFIQIEDGDAVVESQGRWSLVSLAALKPASEDDIEAGHRIDKPSNSRELEILDKPENHISPNCKVTEAHINEADKLNRLGRRMDKCREEFEKQKYWIGLFRADVDFDMTLGKFGRYVSNGSRRIDAMYLESFNEKWEAWANAWQHQQAKVEELQTLYTQQGINMLKMQKRVDAVIIEIENMYLSGAIGFDTVKKLEQALKGINTMNIARKQKRPSQKVQA
ncbi:hypothetical protein BANRA_00520 [Acinetobacter baumannii]|nr:hypothetical protein BANRA_00520 [Acinetobacter baumannii]